MLPLERNAKELGPLEEPLRSVLSFILLIALFEA